MGSFIFSKFADFKGFLEENMRFQKTLDVFEWQTL